MNNWMGLYKKTDPQYKILHDYWDTWVKPKEKDIMVKSRDGLKMRTIHSILDVREKEDEVQGGAAECYAVELAHDHHIFIALT